ncbi:MAG: glycerophosphodiester phosphodiesterase family protein [Pseudomonadota bacterium]
MPAPSWLFDRPIAHRGLHGLNPGCPENSLAAFEAAIARGYAIECDIQGAADGTPMVFHDRALDRMTGIDGAIDTLDAPALQALRMAGTRQTIPTLDAALAVVDGRVPLLIEIKPDARCVPLTETVAQRLARYPGPAALQSFDIGALRWLRRHAPTIPRGLLTGTFAGQNLPLRRRLFLQSAAALPLIRPHYLGVELAHAGAAAIRVRRRAGLAVITWGIFGPADFRTARAISDNQIFEGFLPDARRAPRAPRRRRPHGDRVGLSRL